MEKYDAKVFKNDEGAYRVKIFGYMDASGQGRWLMDSDLMFIMASSHRSKELTFASVSSANRAIAQFYECRERTNRMSEKSNEVAKQYSDTWKPLDNDPQPQLKSRTDEAGNYHFYNVNELIQWAIRKLKK